MIRKRKDIELVERITTNLISTANIVVHASRTQRASFIQILSVNIKVSTILWQHLELVALYRYINEKQTLLILEFQRAVLLKDN